MMDEMAYLTTEQYDYLLHRLVQILPAQPEDKPAMMMLFKTERHMWTDPGTIWWRYWSGGPARIEHWDKAVVNGEIVGFCHWRMRGDNSRSVDDIIVAPTSRGKGVGRALIKAVGTPINLKTDEGSPSNIFYQRLGFIQGATTEALRTNKRLVNYHLPKEFPVTPTGPWITTYTGKKFDLLNPQAKDICIEDIAHALACVNRFAGHTNKPISVAQHSVYVSRQCPGSHALQALLHDASEAYLGDITFYLKKMDGFGGFRTAEDTLERAIFAKFGCALEMHPDVWRADRVMVMFEAAQGFGHAWDANHLPTMDPVKYSPITPEEQERIGHWAPWSWRQAEEAFLVRFRSVCMR